MSKKLEKVLEHLINGNEDKAKELLHQVFIEKARSIHEELINMDEEHDIDGDDMNDFAHEVDHKSDELDELANEIEAEETMAEDEVVDMDAEIDMPDDMGGEMDDMGDDADMMDMGDAEGGDMGDEMGDDMGDDMGDETPDVEDLEDQMHDLEDALAELKAEFEKLESGEDMSDDDSEVEDEVEVSDEDSDEEEVEAEEELDEAAVTEEDECDEDEEEMDESWLSEFDDLEESVSLEKVAVPHGEGEVGSGHYAPVETNKKSPIAKAPDAVMGAKPVKTGDGPTAHGYKLETAPAKKGELPHTEDNRRKKSTDKMTKVSKEGDGAAKLNKTKSEFGADTNKMSPLSKAPRK